MSEVFRTFKDVTVQHDEDGGYLTIYDQDGKQITSFFVIEED